jgi:two-component system KDP operon response regulator KdpE
MTSGPRTLRSVSTPDQVLVLASDRFLVETIRRALRSPDFEVRSVQDTPAAARTSAEWPPDFAIVDLDANHALLDWASATWLPTIALTQREELRVSLDAFDRGADDAIIRPFAPQELLARAQALLRRARRTQPLLAQLRSGELRLDLVRRQAMLGEADLHLTSVERSLLYLLVSHPGQVLTRDAILNAIWGPEDASESNLVDRHIRNLRVKLGDDWRHPRFIATVAGHGYRFLVPVQPVPLAAEWHHGNAARVPVTLQQVDQLRARDLRKVRAEEDEVGATLVD